MAYEKELEIAIDAAKQAGDFLKTNLGKVTVAEYKQGQHDFATQSDLDAQASIVANIKKEFSDDQFLFEEDTEEVDPGGRVWIIDPIDGTRNYANGMSAYCVSIGLWDKGEVKLGVIYAPNHSEDLFTAIKGQGVMHNGEKLEVLNPDQELKNALMTLGFAYYRGQELHEKIVRLEIALNAATDVIRYASAALEHAFVAAGKIGGFVEEGLKPWDVAAGMLFIQEQGGMVTDFKGESLRFFDDEGKWQSLAVMSAKNKKIHDELRKILADHL